MQDDINQEIKNIKEYNSTMSQFIHFLMVSFLSVIIYLLIASLMKVSISDIVDLELPLIVVLSLLLSYFAEINRIIVYPIFTALCILSLLILPQYAFFIIIVLASELMVFTLNKIIDNKKDFKA